MNQFEVLPRSSLLVLRTVFCLLVSNENNEESVGSKCLIFNLDFFVFQVRAAPRS